MKILGYKGISLISKLIRWQTRSPYSHVALMLDDGRVIESWPPDGVQINPSYRTVHKRGTRVDVFRIDYDFDRQFAQEMALSMLGMGYDYWSVLRFVTRRDAPDNDRVFCSELVFMVCEFLLDRIKAQHVSPGVLLLSPYLKLERTVTC